MFDMLLKQLMEAAGGADRVKSFLDEWQELVKTVRGLDERLKRVEEWQKGKTPPL